MLPESAQNGTYQFGNFIGENLPIWQVNRVARIWCIYEMVRLDRALPAWKRKDRGLQPT